MKGNSNWIKQWGLRQYISIISAIMIALNTILPAAPVFAEENVSSDTAVESSASESAPAESSADTSSDSDPSEASDSASDSSDETANSDEWDSADTDSQAASNEDDWANVEENTENPDGGQNSATETVTSEDEDNSSEWSEEKDNSTDQSWQNGDEEKSDSENVVQGGGDASSSSSTSWANTGNLDSHVADDTENDEWEASEWQANANDEQEPGLNWAENYNPAFDIEKIINDLNLNKEKRVAVVAKKLWIDWDKENWEYAKLVWIEKYVGSLEQNMAIRNYLISNAQEIYKETHWWNEWDTLPLTPNEKVEEVKLNAEPITWEATYNWVTVNVVAPAESFPEGTILKIKSLWDDDSMTAIDITTKEIELITQVDEVEYDANMVSFDISFYASDDIYFANELQPAEWKTVEVTFDYAENKEFKDAEQDNTKELKVFHINDKDEAWNISEELKIEEVEIVKNKEWIIAVEAESFSTYTITIIPSGQTSGTATVVSSISDLKEAINKANENDEILLSPGETDTITLDEDIAISKSLKIWLWWMTIEWWDYGFIFNWGSSEISNWTIKSNKRPIRIGNWANVRIYWDNTKTKIISSDVCVTSSNAGSKLTIDWGTFECVEWWAMAFNGAELEINWWEFTVTDNFVIWTNGTSGRWNNTITINWWTFNGNITSAWYVACWIYAANDDIITVNGWTFSIENWVWVAVRAGKVTIKEDAIFEVTWDWTAWKVWDSRVVLPSGTKVVVDTAAQYPGLEEDFSVNTTQNSDDNLPENWNQLVIINGENEKYISKTAKDVQLVAENNAAKIKAWEELSTDPSGFLADWKMAETNGDKSKIIDVVATVTIWDTTTNYSSLKAAFDYVNSLTEPPSEIPVIKLQRDFTTDYLDRIDVTKNLIFDLSYHTLNIKPCSVGWCAKTDRFIEGKNNVEVTIKDGTINDSVRFAANTLWGNWTTINLKGLTVNWPKKTTNLPGSQYFLYAPVKINDWTLNIESTTINAQNTWCAEVSGNKGVLTIWWNSEFSSNVTNDKNNWAEKIAINVHNGGDTDHSKVYISEGNIKNNGSNPLFKPETDVTIGSCTPELIAANNGSCDDKKPTFNKKPEDSWIADWHTIESDWDSWKVVYDPVAEVYDGDTLKWWYSSLGNAINAVKDETVKEYYVAAQNGKFVVVSSTNNSEPTIPNNFFNYVYLAKLSTSISNIDAVLDLKWLTVEVDENTGAEGDKITTESNAIQANINNTIATNILWEVILTYKNAANNAAVSTIEFSTPIKLRIPVKGDAQKVMILANHGNWFWTDWLTSESNTNCSNTTATPTWTPVENGYATIYTCKASTFVAVDGLYYATLDSNGADVEWTQYVYYKYGVNGYYENGKAEYTDSDKKLDVDSTKEGAQIKVPYKKGVNFLWYFDSSCSGTQVIDADGTIKDTINTNSNKTYIACYDNGEFVQYYFDYDQAGEWTSNTWTYKYGKYPITLVAPTPESPKKFMWWNFTKKDPSITSGNASLAIELDCTENNATCTFTMPDSDVFATAKYGYTITWKNGDNELKSEVVAIDETPSYSGETPTKVADDSCNTDHTFKGWAPEIASVTGEATYTAQFKCVPLKTYTITWIVGESTITGNVTEGQIPSYNWTPTKDSDTQYNYTFKWWTGEDNKEYFNGATLPVATGNATYTAQFDKVLRKYTIKFANYDGSILSQSDIEYDQTPTAPANPSKPSTAQYNYEFKGWSPAITDETKVTGEATYTAQFTETTREYAIKFVKEDWTTELKTVNIAYGSTPIYDWDTPTKENSDGKMYTFDGWTRWTNNSSIINPNNLPPVVWKETYTAHFAESPIQYTVTFDTKGWDAIDPMTVNASNPTITLPATTRKWYSLDGWCETDDNNCTVITAENNQYTVTENKTLYAKWTPGNVSYSIIHYTINGKNNDKQLESEWSAKAGDVVDKNFINNNIVKQTYLGYDFTGCKSNDTVIKWDWTTVIKCYYEKKADLTVKFNSDGGTNVEDQTVEYNAKVSEPTAPTKTWHTFKEWTLSGSAYNFATPVTEDITLIADWTINWFTINFDTDGGSNIEPITKDYGTDITAPADPTKEWYTFTGWDKEIPSTMPAENLTIKAQWTVNQYTITFNNEDWTILATGTVTYWDTPVYSWNTPRKFDNGYEYEFLWWTPEISAVTGNITYTAKFWNSADKHRIHTITWLNDDGTQINTTTVEYWEKPAHEDVSKADSEDGQFSYTFAGWIVNDNDNPISSTDLPEVSGDTTYKAKFTENIKSYTITWVDGNDKVLNTGEFTWWATPTYSGYAPIKDSTTYQSYEWDNSNPWTPTITTVTWDATYTANFKQVARKYILTFDLNGWKIWESTGNVTQNLRAWDTPTTQSNPTKDGYTFNWWNPEVPTKMSTEDVTVVAQWTASEYTVTFDVNWWSALDPSEATRTVTFDQPYWELPTPNKDWNVFLGWFTKQEWWDEVKSDSIYKLTGNQILYAQWSETLWEIEPLNTCDNNNCTTPHGSYTATLSWDTLTFSNITLQYPDDNINRGQWDKAWLGIKLIAPKSVTEANKSNAKFSNWTTEYSLWTDGVIDWTTSDGRFWIGMWLPITIENIETASNSTGKSIQRKVTMSSDWIDTQTLNVIANIKSTTIKSKDWNSVEIQTDENWNIIDKNQYFDVTFDSDWGSSVQAQSVRYNTSATKPNPAPTKTWHSFSGWFEWNNGNQFDFSTKIIEDKKLTAKWTANEYTITFKLADDETIDETAIPANSWITVEKDNNWKITSITKKVTYDQPYWDLPTPVKSWSTFNSWKAGDTAINKDSKVAISSDSDLTADWKSNSTWWGGWGSAWGNTWRWGGWGGWWGGWGSSRPSSNSGTNTPTTWNVTTWNNQNIEETLTGWNNVINSGNNSETSFNIPTPTDIERYGQQFADIYVWARSNDITNANDIKETKMYTPITRWELAKMMTKFMANVLWKQPVISGNAQYPDVNPNSDLADYIQLAYQYQIMGINADGTPIKNFNPNKKVSRAEFATVLSRVLFWNSYNQDGKNYFEKHMKALKDAWILSNTNPSIEELRWYVMIMLERAQNLEWVASYDNDTIQDIINDDSNKQTNTTDADVQKYGQELVDIYNWAFENWITTIDNINNARLNTEITRAELAKMITTFMANILWKEPTLTGTTNYEDVNPNNGLAAYTQLAYQYQIMGINADGTPMKKFNPNQKVSRWEFSTILSRVLFGDKYNVNWANYYTQHINALHDAKILNNTDPKIREWRGWILTMLYKAKDIQLQS